MVFFEKIEMEVQEIFFEENSKALLPNPKTFKHPNNRFETL